jgi:ribonuclease HI
MKIEYHFAYKSMRAMKGIVNFIVLIFSNNLDYKTSVHLKYLCTNSQAEYEALQFGLQNLVDMGVKDIIFLGFASGSATI